MTEPAPRRAPASSAVGRRRLLVNATDLARQPGARRHVDATVALDDLDVDDPRLTGDVTIDVTAVSTLDDIEVAGTLLVAWADHCSRCLRPLSGPLVVDIDERYAEPSADPGRPDDPEAFPIVHGQIDLAPMVREELLLAVPDAPRCRPDCPGLCPICGADLTAGPCGCDTTVRDERWAVLDQLKGLQGDEPDDDETGDATTP